MLYLLMGLLDFWKPQSERYKSPEVVGDLGTDLDAISRAYAENRGSTIYHVLDTHSMEPTLMGGDHISIDPVPYDELKEGDIISYRPKWVVDQRHVGSMVTINGGGGVCEIKRAMGNKWLVAGPDGKEQLVDNSQISAPPVTHRIVQKDGAGWIASGDNNRRSESWERVTKDNYVGRVGKIYRVKKQEQKQ